MNIQSVLGNQEANRIAQAVEPQRTSSAEAQQQFKTFLKDAIQDVNASQMQSDQLTNQLVAGEPVALHEVMVAAQKASITLNATMEVRNKVVEAYQEIIRMQV
ncbi:MAG TPA: flagellar hook-basal body complex protein FliE [Sporosarcina sp.]|nr:flagellar hook-basal body complex protein FliE [Sporosarcina sp.]